MLLKTYVSLSEKVVSCREIVKLTASSDKGFVSFLGLKMINFIKICNVFVVFFLMVFIYLV